MKDVMVVNQWKRIWNKKPVVSDKKDMDEFTRYCELKKANGFDVAVRDEKQYFESFYREWKDFFEKVTTLVGGEIKSVYEVGCGSGVNLYMFQNRIECIRGGCDYSDSMIKSAKLVTGCKDFRCCEASEISIVPKYDLVMSESVFQYFESLEYAEAVLLKMIEKSEKLTYIGDIHNAQFEQELMEYRKKTIDDYETRYKGLSKLFFDKDWILEIAARCGKRVVFTEVNNSEYINGKYLFNCYIF